LIIVITKVENYEKQVVSFREALMNQIHREGHVKELINILHAQSVAEYLVHEGKVILVDFEVTVEFFLIVLLAGLVV
jgi:hypothetical protein